jgi:DNA-binding GntR family transcriptional regulator
MARDVAVQSDSSTGSNAARDFRLAIPEFAAQQSLREQIADSLRAAFISGQMRPGVVYSVPVLAERFGISATPVREAMLDLAKEGLFEPVRNKGFRVTELSDKELDDITHVRGLIEVPTVTSLAETAEPKAVRALRPLAKAIVDAAAAADVIVFLETDRRFHLELLGLAGNAEIVKVVGDLRARTRLYGLERLAQQERLAASAAEHFELLDALQAHDAPRAEKIMRRHLAHVRGIWADRPED